MGWGEVGILGWSSTETEKDPGKVMEPVRSSGVGTKGGFQAAVETFNEAIGLRMAGSGGVMSYVEEATELEPEGGGELRAQP